MSGLTREQVLAELADLYRREERQAGDVDKFDVAKALNCSDKQASLIMHGLAERGQYTEHQVRGIQGRGCTVWRKVVK